MGLDTFAESYGVLKEAGINRAWNPSRIELLLDHYIPALSVAYAEDHELVREAVKRFGIEN